MSKDYQVDFAILKGCLKLEPQGGFEGKAVSGVVSGQSPGIEGRVTRVWVKRGNSSSGTWKLLVLQDREVCAPSLGASF